MRVCILVLITICPAQPAWGQSSGAGRPGDRALMPRAEEIALARSAAPASISAAARVYVLSSHGWIVGDSGTSGVACLVNRSWPAAVEPECFDEEAAATILPMEMRRTELYRAGTAADQVEREIADGLLQGRYRLPHRLAVAYMMSAGQRLISDEGRPAGQWRPHLMIYYPFLTNQQIGHHAEPGIEAGLVVDPGKPTANLMVIVPEFIPVAPGNPRP
jgi:hypothetical protein